MTIQQLAAQAAAALYEYGGTSFSEAQLTEILAAALTDLNPGDDVVFCGVASLNTSPGKLFAPGFYVAVDEGTYNALGKVDVDAGDIAIISTDATAPLTWTLTIAYSGQIAQFDARYVKKANVVTSISDESTDEQVPSAKCVYTIVGDIETLLASI